MNEKHTMIKKEISKANWEDLPHEHHHGQESSHGNLPVSILYSFDHAQLVHIPSNPLQSGPAYFKTARVRYLAYVVKGVVSR